MPFTQLVAIWLGWLMLCCGSDLVNHPRWALREQHADMLHSFFHNPFSRSKSAAVPNDVHQQQQQMLEALHQHKHQDLHAMLAQQQAQQQQQQHASHAGIKSAPRPILKEAASPPVGSVNASEPSSQDLLHTLHSKWPDGYVAVCAIVKDQGRDLRYWVEYHRWLGVSKFYIFDNNSTLPAMLVLWDYMQQGIVDYQYFVGRPRRKPDFLDTNQYRAYHGCLLQHFRQHRWLAFIDVDEFFVFPPANLQGSSASSKAALAQDPHSTTGDTGGGLDEADSGNNATDSSSSSNLAVFLSQYEQHAALGINWVLFGSSGLQQRPSNGPLGSYTSCVSPNHWESTHVKVIANTGGVLGAGRTPHEIAVRPGKHTVDVDGQTFKGPKTTTAKWHKLVLHHYVLKSKSEYETKIARGSGAGNTKTWSYWDYLEGLSNHTCTWGLPISRAFLSSRPRLRIPRQGHFCSRGRAQATTAAAGNLKGVAEQPRQLSEVPQPVVLGPGVVASTASKGPGQDNDNASYGWQ